MLRCPCLQSSAKLSSNITRCLIALEIIKLCLKVCNVEVSKSPQRIITVSLVTYILLVFATSMAQTIRLIVIAPRLVANEPVKKVWFQL